MCGRSSPNEAAGDRCPEDRVLEVTGGSLPESAAALTDALKIEGRSLGFSHVGVAGPEASAHMGRYRAWVAEGRHGEMGYLARPDSVERRGDLKLTSEGVRSVVVVAHEYGASDPAGVPEDPARGVVARYARGDDYHDVIGTKLLALACWLRERVGSSVNARPYIDTGPILERDLAERAGHGWFGKNTMLIHPRRGSYFFVGLLLLDLDLELDGPLSEDRCGSCTSCLDACPTGALLGRDESGAPIMDARRCISYLTIELRGAIPIELRPLMGNRIYGCDICQEVCPWNVRFAEPGNEPAYRAREGLDGPGLVDFAERLLSLSGKRFLREFAGSPLTRAGRKGLLRNVCVALGNWGSEEGVPSLTAALADPAPLVRGHAAWALARVDSPDAVEALSSRLLLEEDGWVRDEISSGLGI